MTTTETTKRAPIANRLYTGELSFDIVGRSRRWYAISAGLLAVAVLAILVRGLTLGIEFTGGSELTAPAPRADAATVTEVRGAVVGSGVAGAADPIVTAVGDDRIRVQTGDLTTAETNEVRDAVAAELGAPTDDITVQVVGPSWGEEITRKALLGLLLFLGGVVLFLSVAFEWKMAVAAIAALVHDIVATVGIYALVGFAVTPATVIGFITILGYSLYDTVVVFDKVRENTKGITAQNRLTYSEAANLAVNQTLVRSVNTSVIALLPIGAILFVGAGLLGAGTLKDLALALFIGVAVGTYSSVFIATPLLADLKEREPTLRALTRRVRARRGAVAAGAVSETAPGTPTGSRRPGAVTGRREVGETGERHQPQRSTRAQRRGGRPPGRR
ncbi:MAG TPA: protein translocase subunit SecF [Jiangellales bacterium]|nr:protein translocase subunit SecF [Jiangellales bacterium]